MKKYVFIPLFLLLILGVFTGCSEMFNFPTEIKELFYDTLIFNIPMKDVIESSKDFVKSSILSESKSNATRSAMFELSEEDTWQGYVGYEQWNVPSNVYGVDLDTAENVLFVNGEDLGLLQDLVHHKDEYGNYVKAVFEYNGYLYYVLDKETDDGGYVVLSTEDDLEHICFDQEGKLDSPDFSNFKIWRWEEGFDGKMYRTGNLGYAYTLRNVKMQDGSYATVTVSGYNYYNYGFRVWIKPSEGNDVKIEYPVMDETNTSESYKYDISMDMDKYFTSPEEASFIFEFKNESNEDLVIYNTVYDPRVSIVANSLVTRTESVEVKVGETVSFYYDAEKMEKDLYGHGFLNYVEGWEYYWGCGEVENLRGEKVVLTMTNDGEKCESGPILDTTEGLEDYFASPEEADFIFQFTNEIGKDLEIYNLIYDNRNANVCSGIRTESVIVKDGETVSFYYDVDEILSSYDRNYFFANITKGNNYSIYIENTDIYNYYLIDESMKNLKVVVTMTNDFENGGESVEYFYIE